jgi:hypothetical protein
VARLEVLRAVLRAGLRFRGLELFAGETASSAMRASAVSWLEAGARFQNDGLEHNTKDSVTSAGYREDDFANAGRRGRISDGVMVLAAGSRPQDRKGRIFINSAW